MNRQVFTNDHGYSLLHTMHNAATVTDHTFACIQFRIFITVQCESFPLFFLRSMKHRLWHDQTKIILTIKSIYFSESQQ